MLDGVAATAEQQKPFLGAAYRRTGDMDVLLNQLFYLSKLETGNMPLSVQEVDMVEFIRIMSVVRRKLCRRRRYGFG